MKQIEWKYYLIIKKKRRGGGGYGVQGEDGFPIVVYDNQYVWGLVGDVTRSSGATNLLARQVWEKLEQCHLESCSPLIDMGSMARKER